ncbi:hypothetical protein [Lactobacillus phage PMBT4]|nr:hypothetical protein [Lactobacillus phage PMBT4]
MNSNYETWDIRGQCLEYFDDTHTYIYGGVILPSVTQIIKTKFGHKYDGVPSFVLQRASIKGTAVHSAIERYCKLGDESELPELHNFKFLRDHYGFTVLDNEVPIVLFQDDNPVCAGRLDLVLEQDGVTGLADIKRTYTLDKEYLAYQLNLYRLAYQQCYGTEIKFLKGVHLREEKRKYVDIPVNEEMAWNLVKDWRKENEH